MLFKLSSHPDSNQLDNQIVKLSSLHVFICIYIFCGGRRTNKCLSNQNARSDHFY